MGKGKFWGLSGPLKSTVSHCMGFMQQNNSNGINAIAAADCIAPDWPVSH